MKRPGPSVACAYLAELHARFLSLLPRIELHGRIYFRHLRCPHQKADAIQEMCALAWKWFLRLHQRGRDPAEFVKGFVGLLARAVNSGRRVVGMERAKDVLSPPARKRHDFVVGKLPDFETLSASPLKEALADSTVSPVPEQVCFRIDFPVWRRTYTRRDRRLIDGMVLGERTLDLARKFGISPARISQLRREFREDWERYCGEPSSVV
jgi:hypothetical protein